MAEFPVVDLSGEGGDEGPLQLPEPAVGMTVLCEVHKHHSPKPTVHHHVWPKGMGGPNVRANMAYLCEDGHAMTHNYLDLLIKNDPNKTGADKVPWLSKIAYGGKVRQLARLGYSRYLRNSI